MYYNNNLKKKCCLILFDLFSGYVYLIFDSEKSVKALLASCTHDFCNGGDWYFKISSRRMRCKEVNKYLGTKFVSKYKNPIPNCLLQQQILLMF